jgi:hypothetical protein
MEESNRMACVVLPELTADQLASLLLGAAKFQTSLGRTWVHLYLDLYQVGDLLSTHLH